MTAAPSWHRQPHGGRSGSVSIALPTSLTLRTARLCNDRFGGAHPAHGVAVKRGVPFVAVRVIAFGEPWSIPARVAEVHDCRIFERDRHGVHAFDGPTKARCARSGPAGHSNVAAPDATSPDTAHSGRTGLADETRAARRVSSARAPRSCSRHRSSEITRTPELKYGAPGGSPSASPWEDACKVREPDVADCRHRIISKWLLPEISEGAEHDGVRIEVDHAIKISQQLRDPQPKERGRRHAR